MRHLPLTGFHPTMTFCFKSKIKMYILVTYFHVQNKKETQKGYSRPAVGPLCLFTYKLAFTPGLIGSFGDILCSTHAARTSYF